MKIKHENKLSEFKKNGIENIQSDLKYKLILFHTKELIDDLQKND